jgi:hypothetical protein
MPDILASSTSHVSGDQKADQFGDEKWAGKTTAELFTKNDRLAAGTG